MVAIEEKHYKWGHSYSYKVHCNDSYNNFLIYIPFLPIAATDNYSLETEGCRLYVLFLAQNGY